MNMKNVSALICAIAMILTPVAQAATNTWDSTAGGAINDGAGAWLDAGQWNNGSPSATWSSGDDAIFGVRGTGGAVTLASPTTANSLTFNPFSGAYTIGTSGQALTLTNGITLNSGAGAVTLISPITLGAAQSWVNNSASLLAVGTDTVSKAGYLLTVGGSGNTTVSGIIDGAGGLAKSGAGTLTLNGTNASTFTGGLGITNGTVILDFVSRGANANLVATGNDLTLASGTLQLTGNSANNSAQTLGNVTLTPGGAQILINPNGAARTATLTLGTIATNTAGSTLLIGKVSGASGTTVITTTTDKDATGIYGGRVVAFNGTANTGYDFATSSGAGPYTLANYAGYTTLPTAATSDTLNDQMTGNTTLAGAQTHNTLKIGSGLTLANGGFDTVLTAGGLLSVGSVASTISGTGTLTADNGSGAYELIIHQYNSAGLTISSVITNNGANAVTLVKSGSSTLILSGANNFSGGTVINAGTVAVKDNANLGATGIGITVNGPAALSCGNYPSTGGLTVNLGTRPITINNGAIAGLYHNWADTTITIDGAVTGNGGIIWGRDPVLGYIGGSGSVRLNLNSTGNTFTGPLTVGTGDDNAQGYGSAFSFSSLGDSTHPITFNFQYPVACNFNAAGPISNLSLPNRPINLLTSSATINNQNATYTMTLGAVSTRTAGAKTLQLVNGGAGGTIAGAITDGNGQIAVAKSGGGTWVFSGANTYSGATTISGGILSINSIANVNGGASALGLPTTAANGTITISGGATLQYTGSGHTSDRVINMTGATTLDASGTGAWVLTSPLTGAQALTLTGNSTAANTIGGALPGTTLTKSGIGTWMLSGANTLTSTTTLSGGGALILDYTTQNNSKLADGASLTLSGGTLTLKDGSHTEVVLSTTLNTAGTFLTRSGSSTGKLRLNAIGRAVGGTISFADATIADTDTANANGILGGWATLGSDWATSAASGTDISITALPGGSYTAWAGTSPGSGTANYLLSGPGSITGGNLVANTVKIIGAGTDDTLALGANNLTITALGGLLYAGGGNNNYNVTGSGVLGAGSANEFIVTTVAGTLNVSAPIIGSGAGILTKTGVGTLVLNAASLYTGATYVNQGTLRLANATATGTTGGGIFVQNGAAVEFANGITVGAEAITVLGTGVASGGALSNYSGTNTYAGAITVGTGGALIKSVSGLLTLGGAIATTLSNDLTFDGAGDVTVTNVISGAGRVIKNGTGTLTLTTNNTYSGVTLINEGTLVGVVGGSCSNSAVTVASAGALGVSVTDNSKKWTCASLALNNGSQLKFNFTGTPSTTVAPLNILGSLTFSGTPTIVVSPINTAPGTYPLLTVGGVAPTALPTLSGVTGKLFWGGAGNKTLYVTIIPAGTVITFR